MLAQNKWRPKLSNRVAETHLLELMDDTHQLYMSTVPAMLVILIVQTALDSRCNSQGSIEVAGSNRKEWLLNSE
jgi:hypothetical protein